MPPSAFAAPDLTLEELNVSHEALGDRVSAMEGIVAKLYCRAISEEHDDGGTE